MRFPVRVALLFLPLVGLVLSCSEVSVPNDESATVSPYDDNDCFIPKILVRAKVVDVPLQPTQPPDGWGTYYITRFRIEQVYSGPTNLKGQEFRQGMSPPWVEGSVNYLYHYAAVLAVGEVGIWALLPFEEQFPGWDHPERKWDRRVWPDEKALSAIRELRPPADRDQKKYYPLLPSYQREKDHPQMQQWAEAVEVAYQRKGTDRLAVLKKFAQSDNRYIEAWATDLLDRLERAAHGDEDAFNRTPNWPRRTTTRPKPTEPARPPAMPTRPAKPIP